MADSTEQRPDSDPQTQDNERNVGRIIARNTIFGLGEQFGLRLTNFLFSVFIIRSLGDSEFGQYSIVLAWASLFSVIGDMGITQYLTRETARDPKNAATWFWDVVVLRLLLAIVAIVVTVGGAILYGYPPEIVLGIFLFTLTYFFQVFLAPLTSLLVGNERIDVVSVLRVINQIIFIITGSIFLLSGFNFIALIVAAILTMPILIVLSLWVILRNEYGPPPFRIRVSTWRFLLIAGFPFAFTQLSLSFAFDSDTIFLSFWYPDSVVGWYAAAYRLMLTLLIFSNPFNEAIMPSLARQHATDPDSVTIWYHRTVRIMILLLLPIAVGGTLVADQLIVFLYGIEFAPAAIAFAILIWYIPFHIYTSFSGNLANVMRKEGQSARIFGIEGGLNIVLNIIMIPPLGLIGAAFATVITDIVGAALFYFLLRKELGPGLQLRRILRVMAASLVMGVVVFLLRDLNLFLVIAVGAGVYFVTMNVFGAVTRDERQWALEMFRKLLKRTPLRRLLSTG